ncbi:MAG: hypothetical protein ACJ79L_08690, partial [Anaeromyxobacteraceae bacterium]
MIVAATVCAATAVIVATTTTATAVVVATATAGIPAAAAVPTAAMVIAAPAIAAPVVGVSGGQRDLGVAIRVAGIARLLLDIAPHVEPRDEVLLATAGEVDAFRRDQAQHDELLAARVGAGRPPATSPVERSRRDVGRPDEQAKLAERARGQVHGAGWRPPGAAQVHVDGCVDLARIAERVAASS